MAKRKEFSSIGLISSNGGRYIYLIFCYLMQRHSDRFLSVQIQFWATEINNYIEYTVVVCSSLE